jgi:hypothetical protein
MSGDPSYKPPCVHCSVLLGVLRQLLALENTIPIYNSLECTGYLPPTLVANTGRGRLESRPRMHNEPSTLCTCSD